MMAAMDLRVQLVQLRTHVRRRDVMAAEELLGVLIDAASRNGHAPTLKLPPLRKPARDTCPFGWRYSAKGRRQRNRKHACGPECSWSSEEALEWNPPYKVLPGLEITSRLVPVPQCAKCDRPRRDHWEAIAGDDGRLQGFREIEACQYTAAQ